MAKCKQTSVIFVGVMAWSNEKADQSSELAHTGPTTEDHTTTVVTRVVHSSD